MLHNYAHIAGKIYHISIKRNKEVKLKIYKLSQFRKSFDNCHKTEYILVIKITFIF